MHILAIDNKIYSIDTKKKKNFKLVLKLKKK